MTALFETILTTVQSDIRALALTGVASANVTITKSVVTDNRNLPNVQISFPRPEIMKKEAGTNTKDEVVYPILVTLMDADNQNQTVHFPDYLTWRKRVAAHFRHQPLSGVSEVHTCHVEPVDVIDEKKWSDLGLYLSGLLLLFSAREARG